MESHGFVQHPVNHPIYWWNAPAKVELTLVAAAYWYEQTQVAVREAEDKIIAIAHRIPCDCGSNDHFPTPVRSVTGSVTRYCQFNRVVLSQAPDTKQTEKEKV